MNFFVRKKEKTTAISSFLQEIGLGKGFYSITFVGYVFGFILQGTGVTLMIPLIKGLIEKDYTFIFDNVVVSYIIRFFPFVQNLSDTGIFFLFAGAVIVVTTISMVINYSITMYVWNKREEYALVAGDMILDKVLHTNESFFIKNKSSTLRSQLAGIISFVRTYIDLVQGIIQKYFEVITSVALLFIISYRFALIAVAFIVLSLLVFLCIKKTIQSIQKKVTISDIKFASFLQDIFSKREIIQSSDTGKQEGAFFREEYRKRVKQRRDMIRIEGLINPISTLFQIMALSTVGFIISSTLFSTATISVPAAIMFLILFHRAMKKSTDVSTNYAQMKGVKNAYSDIIKMMMSDTQSVHSGDSLFHKLETDIVINDLSFSYDDKKVFSNFRARIPLHKLTLITGKNGSGKSTLVSLLMKLLETQPGTIFVNNLDIREFENTSWRKNISYVAQDVTLFNGSIRENIIYGNENITDKKIFKILEKVQLRDYVESMVDGLDTNIADGGKLLSGGQRQRIVIARALLREPEIVIFDEATKSVDHSTEKIIWNLLQNDLKHTTRIVVSHNKEHEALADAIISLESVH